MTYRFAELWLVEGFLDCSFDDAVEQLTLLFVNALGLRAPSPTASVANSAEDLVVD